MAYLPSSIALVTATGAAISGQLGYLFTEHDFPKSRIKRCLASLPFMITSGFLSYPIADLAVRAALLNGDCSLGDVAIAVATVATTYKFMTLIPAESSFVEK